MLAGLLIGVLVLPTPSLVFAAETLAEVPEAAAAPAEAVDATAPANAAEVESAPAEETAAAPMDEGAGAGAALMSGEEEVPSDDRGTVVRGQTLPQVEQGSGALGHDIPITVPPGRAQLTPQLALQYNSHATDDLSWLGYGWSLNIPYIERVNTRGVDRLYTSYDFTSSFDGELASTSQSTSTPTLYRPKSDDGSFRQYYFTASSSWEMKDKNGLVYKFGTTTSSRLNSLSTPTEAFRWMLEEVRDPNGNYIKYEYVKDGAQIYPSRIVYTGNGTTDGSFEVSFTKSLRTDIATSSRSGFTVASKYLITEIQAKVSGSWVRKYTLAYTTGDNKRRSLLSSVTESAQGDTGELTFPVHNFFYQSSTTASTEVAAWDMPEDFINSCGADHGTRIADVNGDGLSDVLRWYSPGSVKRVYLNDGEGWNLASGWQMPDHYFGNGSSDTGVRIADVNGDARADIMYAVNGYDLLYLNSATTTGWTLTPWTFPQEFITSTGGDLGTRLMEVNGDGLIDMVRSHQVTGTDVHEVYLNTGSGWTYSSQWDVPVVFVGSYPKGVVLADVNHDGLDDILESYNWTTSSSSKTYLNTGHGWEEAAAWTVPEYFTNISEDTGARLVDVNGDDLPDILRSKSSSPNFTKTAYINTGNGWAADAGWVPEEYNIKYHTGCAINAIKDNGVRYADVDGDGLTDLLYATNLGSHEVKTYLKNASKPDLLSRIDTQTGATMQVAYATPQLEQSGGALLNPDIPFNFPVVDAIGLNSGFGATATTTYDYQGGDYYFANSFDRKSTGFNKVTETDPAGNLTKRFHHQGNLTDSTNGEFEDTVAKRGRVYRVEQEDGSGNDYRLEINKWSTTTIATSSSAFVKRDRLTELSYDGNGTHKDRAEEYTYDHSSGSLTERKLWGEVTGSTDGSFSDVSSDTMTVVSTYATSSTNTAKPLSSQATYNNAGTKVGEQKFYFDSQSFGSATAGNQTKAEGWITGSTYASTTRTYNSYGLVTQERDPRYKLTTYAYDALNLYPSTTTNALSQVTGRTYDYSSGKVVRTTDPNNRVYQSVYDPADRVVAEQRPDLSSPSTLATSTSFVYADTKGARSVKRTDHLSSAIARDSYTYLDGLGRKIQVRIEAEEAFGVGGDTEGMLVGVDTEAVSAPVEEVVVAPATVLENFDELLTGKSAEEKAHIKGAALAKIGALPRQPLGAYEVEILSTEAIDGGVQLFAKVWDKNGQIGFGADGSVEIERFRFFNPPVLVDDPKGAIIRTWKDEDTGEIHTRTLREDPKAALLQSLEHTLSVMQTKHDASRIISGKIGRTTSTFYPNGGTGSSPIDGLTARAGMTELFSSLRSGAGNYHEDNTTSSGELLRIWTRIGATNSWRGLHRSLFGFNTAAIGSDTITAATLSIYGTSKATGFNNQSAVVDRRVPATQSDLVDADYDIGGWAGIEQSSTRIAVGSWNTSGYNNFTLNSTGKGNISGSGNTWLGLRTSADFDNSAPTWASDARDDFGGYYADQTGTASDPKLVVEHVANSAPIAPTNLQTEGQTNPTGVTDPTPEFTAVFNDHDASSTSRYYRIQLSTIAGTWTSPVWDSGQSSMATTSAGSSSPEISYAGAALSPASYYWRIKFWDNLDVEGEWSTTTASFVLDDSARFAVRDFSYDTRGLLASESLPYFSQGAPRSVATTNTALLVSYTYDALHRPTAITNVRGSETHAYDQWTDTATDRNGEVKGFVADAHGNLKEVAEHNGGSTYTTTYTYDPLKNLTSITDALGNLRNFTYDGLSRLTASEDLHASGDSTFGTRTFTYDLAGNATQRVDGKSQTVNFTYDDLNRPLTEDFTGASGTEIAYTYDSCSEGVGRLCSASTTDALTTYAYDAHGNKASEVRTVGGRSFTTSSTYDRVGNLATLTYPNGMEIAYEFNAAGQIDAINMKPAATSTWQYLVTNLDYAPTGAETFRQYANGVETTRTYDPLEMYRLRSIMSATTTVGMGGDPEGLTILAPEQPLDTIIDDLAISSVAVEPDIVQTEPIVEPVVEEVVPDPLVVEVTDVPVGIEAQLAGKSDEERTAIKSRAVVSSLADVRETKAGDYTLELVSVDPIDGGIQIYARVWDAQGQIGFGVDGTVDIERFRFFNPPVLVDDENGDIRREWVDQDTGETHVRTLREDPRAAILQSLSHTLSVMQTKHSSENITPGKLGRTTSTFYPSGGTTAPVDGLSARAGMDESFSSLRSSAGNYHEDTTVSSGEVLRLWARVGSSNNWRGLHRSIFGFNTAALGADTITAATLSVYGTSKATGFNNQSAVVDHHVPANPADLTDSDYNIAGWDGVEQSSARVAVGSWNTAGYNDFALNTTGKGNVNTAGNTWFGLRVSADFDNSAPTWASDTRDDFGGYYADQTGTASDPKLVVEHVANHAPSAPTSLLTEGLTNPTSVSDPTPEFTAIFQDQDATNTAPYFKLQVATSTGWSSFLWDSGKTSMTSTNVGSTSPEISYGGTALASSTTYYWRIKFWDNFGAEGDWSSAGIFSLAASSIPAASSSLQYLTFTYDAVGNITQIEDTSTAGTRHTTLFGYDDLHRLTSASTTAADSLPYSQTYAYNALGNITNKSDIGIYTYAGTGYANPHAATDINGTSYSYDNNGNLTASGSTLYGWDYRDRMATSTDGVTNWAYAYDHENQRIALGAGVSTTTFPSRFYNVKGATSTAHVMLPDGSFVTTIEGNGTATSTYYIHTDHLGGTHVLTNSSQATVEVTDYYPYGTQRYQSGAFDEQRKFIGQPFDEATSLSYLQNRYYSGGNGKFLSQDPLVNALGTDQNNRFTQMDFGKILGVYSTQDPWSQINQNGKTNGRITLSQEGQIMLLADPQMLNSYSYGKNNPIRYTDPNGLQALALPGAEIGAPFGPVGVIGGYIIGGIASYIIGDWLGKSIANLSKPESKMPQPADIQGKSPAEIDKIMKEKGLEGQPSNPGKGGEGTRYPDPNRPGDQVRIMPGKPTDPNPVKQGPYGRVSDGGKLSPPIPLQGNPTLKP